MERRMTGNCHVRCGVGENSEIISKSYLLLLLELYDNNYSDKQLAEMQNAWKTEVLRLGFTHKSEGVSIDKIWENW